MEELAPISEDLPSEDQVEPEEGVVWEPKVVSTPCKKHDWYFRFTDPEGFDNEGCHNCWMGRRVRKSTHGS